MGSMKFYATLAGILAVASSTTARAADLLPPPPPLEAPLEFSGGWYLRGDVGVGSLDIGKFKGVDTTPGFVGPPGGYFLNSKSISDQVFVGAGIGYAWNSWLRFDITGEYRTAAHFSTVESYDYGFGRGYDTVSGHLSSAVGLFNGYVDLGTWWGITPFIGAGVGVAGHNISGLTDTGGGSAVGGIGFAKDNSGDVQLAYAFHAGLGYDVTPNLKLELAYRYLNMGRADSATVGCQGAAGCPATVYHYRDLESQDIKIGMRWLLGGPVYASAPPEPYGAPIIRKY